MSCLICELRLDFYRKKYVCKLAQLSWQKLTQPLVVLRQFIPKKLPHNFNFSTYYLKLNRIQQFWFCKVIFWSWGRFTAKYSLSVFLCWRKKKQLLSRLWKYILYCIVYIYSWDCLKILYYQRVVLICYQKHPIAVHLFCIYSYRGNTVQAGLICLFNSKYLGSCHVSRKIKTTVNQTIKASYDHV